MSRFRSESIWLGLCSDQVGAAALRAGRADALGSADVGPAADPAALGQAAGHLLDLHARRGQTVHTVVSDRLARYLLLPFEAAHLDQREEQALCLARFGAQYGSMEGWSVRVERARYGRARVACALPAQLEGALRAACLERKLRPGSVVPHFVGRWNARPAAFRRAGMLAVAERDSLVLGATHCGGWHSLRALYTVTGPALLGDLIARERLLQRIDPVTVLQLDDAAALDPAAPAVALALQGLRI